jgi:redox-sensitive bicupin YhaK (pirin superfamily)
MEIARRVCVALKYIGMNDMIRIRKANDRGHFNHGWLDTYHTFSFADYYDPANMNFRALRVMNEDRVAPGQGFGMHGHRDMEIVTYVLEGALEHRDSLGTGEVLRPGEFQRMSAGTGIRHSEFNPSPSEAVHLYQIWLLPERQGLNPSYEQKAFDPVENRGRLRVVASRDGREGSLTIHTDASIYLATLGAAEEVRHAIAPGRHAWLQVLRGSVEVNGELLATSDGAAVSGEPELRIRATGDAEVMLFDLA